MFTFARRKYTNSIKFSSVECWILKKCMEYTKFVNSHSLPFGYGCKKILYISKSFLNYKKNVNLEQLTQNCKIYLMLELRYFNLLMETTNEMNDVWNK